MEHGKEDEVLINMLAGALAGSLSRCVVSPLDVIKLKFQSQLANTTRCKLFQKLQEGSKPKYYGLFQSIKTIVQDEGYRGLYKGNVPAVLLWGSYSAVQFPVNSYLKEVFLSDQSHPSYKSFVFGGLAAVIATIATYPLDLIRTTYVCQGYPAIYTSMPQMVSSLYKTGGVSKFYCGLSPTLLQVFPHMALTFTFYDMAMSNLQGLEKIPRSLVAGCVAGLLAKSIIYPLDTIKRRIQLKGMRRSSEMFANIPQYRSMAECFQLMVREESVFGLYKGILPSIIKSGVSAGSTFVLYEFFQSYLSNFFLHQQGSGNSAHWEER